ncbi:unnamed protein product [Parnassius mnemosyne]|uniref:Uncharacterized protein n=1 Tax=Parnassius mnemosyne TaxID=213953 RepID=A0AAV1LH81_9NEOP
MDAALHTIAAIHTQEEVEQQAAEVRELVQQCREVERECGAARHGVAAQVRERAARLHALWDAARRRAAASPANESPLKTASPVSVRDHDSPVTRESSLKSDSVSARDSPKPNGEMEKEIEESHQETEKQQKPESRRSSADSQASGELFALSRRGRRLVAGIT